MPTEEEEREETLPFAMKHLPDYVKEKARRELNETPERRIAALEELKEMARDHKVTCDIHFVDDFLLQFLRHRKYDVSRAFKQLLNLTNLRTSHSFMFGGFDNDIFFDNQLITVLPRRCPEGCTIVLTEMANWNLNEVSLKDYERLCVLVGSQVLRDPMNQINGFKIIFDLEDTSLKHVRVCTPPNVYLLYHALMNCFPARNKAVHLVGESLMMKIGWTVMKPFLSQKLKQRFIVNSSRKDLLNHFPPSVLPVKYGGVLEDYYSTEWTKEANKQQKEFGPQGQCNYY